MNIVLNRMINFPFTTYNNNNRKYRVPLSIIEMKSLYILVFSCKCWVAWEKSQMKYYFIIISQNRNINIPFNAIYSYLHLVPTKFHFELIWKTGKFLNVELIKNRNTLAFVRIKFMQMAWAVNAGKNTPLLTFVGSIITVFRAFDTGNIIIIVVVVVLSFFFSFR